MYVFIDVDAAMRKADPLLSREQGPSLFSSPAFITPASRLVWIVKPVNSCTVMLGVEKNTRQGPLGVSMVKTPTLCTWVIIYKLLIVQRGEYFRHFSISVEIVHRILLYFIYCPFICSVPCPMCQYFSLPCQESLISVIQGDTQTQILLVKTHSFLLIQVNSSLERKIKMTWRCGDDSEMKGVCGVSRLVSAIRVVL